MPIRTCVVTFSDGSVQGREWKRFLVLARDENGFEEDVTAQARFSLSAPGKGGIDEDAATKLFDSVCAAHPSRRPPVAGPQDEVFSR